MPCLALACLLCCLWTWLPDLCFCALSRLYYCVLGPVHPNMAFLPTGITSAKSASMRSKATVLPWVMTLHNLRRKWDILWRKSRSHLTIFHVKRGEWSPNQDSFTSPEDVLKGMAFKLQLWLNKTLRVKSTTII